MTSTPSPTWYDVLGVSRDASADEIKAAWRTATDKFEPGSGHGQFRMFNEAADVLLDPTRRAAYDAQLDAPASDVEPPTTAVAPPPPTPVDLEKTPTTAETEKADKTSRWKLPKRERAPRPVGTPASGRTKLVAVVLAALSVVALALAGWFAFQVREDARVADARDDAPAAAERAAKALFSYDYRRLPADRERAEDFVTTSFGKKYLKNFTQLEKQEDGTPGLAVQSKTVVTASVLGSGVVDAEEDLVRVLVYVNQVSQKPDAEPQIFQNRVAMTMERDDNRWLVDDVKSY